MPTLLGLCGLPIPEPVEGRDWSPYFRDERQPAGDEAALLEIPAEFTELIQNGMKAYRGLRTTRHTYVRNIAGSWLLYDNESDPFQKNNLAGQPAHAVLEAQLDVQLQRRLRERGDEFREGWAYLERDGLTHYVEVNGECAQMWKDPWQPGVDG